MRVAAGLLLFSLAALGCATRAPLPEPASPAARVELPSAPESAGEAAAQDTRAAEGPNYAEVIRQAEVLREQKQYAQARKLLLGAVATVDVDAERGDPQLTGQTLSFYCEGGDTVAALAELSALADLPLDKAREVIQGLFPWRSDLASKYKPGLWMISAARDPTVPRLHHYLGYLAIEEGDARGAIPYLQTAIRLWPGFAAAYSELIYAHTLIGDFATAKEVGREALNFVPSYARGRAAVMRRLGYVAIEEGDYALAARYYEDSLDIEPGHQTALKELEYIDTVIRLGGREEDGSFVHYASKVRFPGVLGPFTRTRVSIDTRQIVVRYGAREPISVDAQLMVYAAQGDLAAECGLEKQRQQKSLPDISYAVDCQTSDHGRYYGTVTPGIVLIGVSEQRGAYCRSHIFSRGDWIVKCAFLDYVSREEMSRYTAPADYWRTLEDEIDKLMKAFHWQ